jgi:hypothetical protein
MSYLNSANGYTSTGNVNSEPDHPDVRVTDDKGRPSVKSMTDRELLEEGVATMRATQDLVEGFMGDFAKNPMLKTMGKMFG